METWSWTSLLNGENQAIFSFQKKQLLMPSPELAFKISNFKLEWLTVGLFSLLVCYLISPCNLFLHVCLGCKVSSKNYLDVHFLCHFYDIPVVLFLDQWSLLLRDFHPFQKEKHNSYEMSMQKRKRKNGNRF